MTASLSRRQFLRGDVRGVHQAIRPPWSIPETEFIQDCTSCGDCIRHCPEHILIAGSGAYPEVDFLQGECTFCGECVQHCETGALRTHADLAPWSLKAIINQQCLARKGVVCERCAEECEAGAISLDRVAGSVALPQLAQSICTGCGACYRICPVSSISMQYTGLQSHE